MVTPAKRQRKTPPEKRQKVTSACDVCKKKKYKCSGTLPCEWCAKKQYTCTYNTVDKRSLKGERMALERRASDITNAGIEPGTRESFSTTQDSRPIYHSITQDSHPIPHADTLPHTDTLLHADTLPHASHTISQSSQGSDTSHSQTSEVSKSTSPEAMSPKSIVLPSISVILSSSKTSDGNMMLLEPEKEWEIPRLSIDSRGGVFYYGDSSVCCLRSEAHYLQKFLGGKEIPLSIDKKKSFELVSSDNILPLPSEEDMYAMGARFVHKWGCKQFIAPEEIKEIVVDVYDHKSDDPVNYVILYMILVYLDIESDKSLEYFRRAVSMLKNHFSYTANKQIAQAHFLVCFYFRTIGYHRECYFHLAVCINICNQLKFSVSENKIEKDFFGSIVFCDAVCSSIVGRTPSFHASNFSVETACSPTKLGQILNQILVNVYNSTSELDLYRVKDLTIQLKSWALQLPEDETIENADSWTVHLMHFSGLLSIILLSRPLFISHILRHCNPDLDRRPLKDMTSHFFVACIQASIYSVQLAQTVKYPKEYAEEPIIPHLLESSVLVIYSAYLFFQKKGLDTTVYKFDPQYLLYCLSLSLPFLEDNCKSCLQEFLSTHEITTFADVDLNHIKYFQGNFVNQDFAPTISNPSRFYDSYDTLILSKV